ncbi:hypothetical protein X474_17960 [Dethiosulfatarculus sandiegensis]|uniref:Uncharacterized protein n=1 Tax=Dethiosulfatarculus sandiegensis TaxID=1429043 RepID=A0A0D2J398_9BACT|nr:hypothetical protein X474_17960 [Dethiosulfatarculus sandiegensis]
MNRALIRLSSEKRAIGGDISLVQNQMSSRLATYEYEKLN